LPRQCIGNTGPRPRGAAALKVQALRSDTDPNVARSNLRNLLPGWDRHFTRLQAALPQGRTLPENAWQSRHRALLLLLWLHALALPVFRLSQGFGVIDSAGDGGVLAVIAGFVYCARNEPPPHSCRWA
jgi:hypothetical protein